MTLYVLLEQGFLGLWLVSIGYLAYGVSLGDRDPGTVTGTGQSAASATTVSVSGSSACVSVCCPGVNGSAACPTTNQCP